MPMNLIDDNEVIMGKRHGAVNVDTAARLKGLREGIAMGESLRQARAQNELRLREQDFREKEATENQKRQAAIDAETMANNKSNREHNAMVTSKMKSDMEYEIAQRKKAELAKSDIPSFIAADMDGMDKKQNIENQNQYFDKQWQDQGNTGPSPYRVKDITSDADGNYTVTRENGQVQNIPKKNVDAMMAEHFPRRATYDLYRDKNEIARKKTEAQIDAAESKAHERLFAMQDKKAAQHINGLRKTALYNIGLVDKMDLNTINPMAKEKQLAKMKEIKANIENTIKSIYAESKEEGEQFAIDYETQLKKINDYIAKEEGTADTTATTTTTTATTKPGAVNPTATKPAAAPAPAPAPAPAAAPASKPAAVAAPTKKLVIPGTGKNAGRFILGTLGPDGKVIPAKSQDGKFIETDKDGNAL